MNAAVCMPNDDSWWSPLWIMRTGTLTRLHSIASRDLCVPRPACTHANNSLKNEWLQLRLVIYFSAPIQQSADNITRTFVEFVSWVIYRYFYVSSRITIALHCRVASDGTLTTHSILYESKNSVLNINTGLMESHKIKVNVYCFINNAHIFI